MSDNYIFLIVSIVISLLIIKCIITMAVDGVYNSLKTQITITFDEICRKQNERYDELILLIAEHSDATEPHKKDRLLYDVAIWAIECRGLSTSAVQRHFSVSYNRAGKIVDQLYSLGVCGPAKGNCKPRDMYLGIEEIQCMQRSGALD